MTANHILTEVRIIAQESNPGQRWSNAQLLPLLSQAQRNVMLDVMWPPSIYIFSTQAGVQYYQMPEVLDTLQVYIAGQPLVRTDIETLQGDDILFFDQTGSGGGPGGFIQAGQPTVLAGGQFTPQWSGQAMETYPVASTLGIDTNTAMPWYPGMRPRYFYDGGVIGFVPPPAGVYPVYVRCIREPADVSQPTDQLAVPTQFSTALTWKTLMYMMFSNAEQPAASDQRNFAQSEYENERRKLLRWKHRYSGGHTKGPKFITYRSFYARGNNRI